MLSSTPVLFLISSASLALMAGLCGLLACHCCLAVYIFHMTAPAAHRADRGPTSIPLPITTPDSHSQRSTSPPTLPIDDEETTDDNLCYACADLGANTALLACGHRGLCLACATRLWQVDRRCPLCRRGVDGVMFLS
jgi:hypothetical protein